MMRKGFGVLLLFLAGTCFGAVPPANDNFANRIILTGNQAVSTGSLAGATREANEVMSCFYESVPTVWWSWTAPETGTAVVQILDIAQSTASYNRLAIYNPADGDTLFPDFTAYWTSAGCFSFNRMSSGVWHTFTASAGRTYHFQATGQSDVTFKLAVSLNPSPIVYGQPRDVTVNQGQCALLTVKAAGVAPLQFQWQHEGTNLPNAAAPALSFTNVTLSDAGNYFVIISSPTGVSTSRIARLEVTQNPAGPRLSAFSSASNQFSFAVEGQRGRLYRIETSTNLVDWLPATHFFKMHSASQPLMTSVVYATNDIASLAVPASSQRFYVRASHYAPANEICNLNLKRVRFASNLWALENQMTAENTPQDSDLSPKLGFSLLSMRCPSGGIYYLNAVGTPPFCTVHTGILEEPAE